MNLEQLETFIEITETGNFNRAAENLNVTQSTVSARIRGLENHLGKSLFERSHAGVTLSAAGQQFRRYATGMMELWRQAKFEVKLPEGFSASIRLGSQVSLWDHLVLKWMPWMRTHAPKIAICVEADYSSSMLRMLSDGLLDISVMYSPRQMSGFTVEKLLDEELMLVSTKKNAPLPPNDPDYVFVDWGEVFWTAHVEAFGNMPTPAVSAGLGPLGMRYVLENGGSGYFPIRAIRPYLNKGQLFTIENAPIIERPAYMIYPKAPKNEEATNLALQGMRLAAAL